MADLTKSVSTAALNIDNVQRATAAALAQPLASTAIRNDLLQISPGLLNTGIVGGIDPGYFRPAAPVALSHVQPGELITATLMNAIIDRLNALGGNTGPESMAGDVTGTTAANQIAALQGKNVLANAPIEGQLLGFANNAWRPVPAPQATPLVVAAGTVQNRGVTTAGGNWGVSSMLGNLVSQDAIAPRFTFDGYNPSFNTYFFRFTLVDADNRGGIATVMPYVLRVAPAFFEIGFQPLGPEARFDPGLILQVEVAAYPRIFYIPPVLITGTVGSVVAGTLNPGVVNLGQTTPTTINPGPINPGVLSSGGALSAGSTPGMVINTGVLAGNAAATPVSAGTASGVVLAQPILASMGAAAPAAVSDSAALKLSTAVEAPVMNVRPRSAPRKTAAKPANNAATRPATSKRSTAKKPAPKGGRG